MFRLSLYKKKISIISAAVLLLVLMLYIWSNPIVKADSDLIDDPMSAQNISMLVNNSDIICDKEDITMSPTKQGVMISGGSDINGAKFSITKDFDFGSSKIGRFTIDGLAQKDVKITLHMYLDDETDSFTDIDLIQQSDTGQWTDKGDFSKDVSAKGITGKHKLSFKVQTDSIDKQSFMLRSLEFVQESLPTLYFNIDESDGKPTIADMNSDPKHEISCSGSMSIIMPDGYKNEYGGEQQKTDKQLQMDSISGRGNSTWHAPKKPYKIKLTDKKNLFNMGKSKKWVLLANYYDNTMLHDKTAYEFANSFGMPFSPQCVFVDVVMNGEYLGSYDLCEKIEVGKERIDIDDLSKGSNEDITGGYLLSTEELGKYAIADSKLLFHTTRKTGFNIESPDFEENFNESQENYIKDYIQRTEDAIYGTKYKNKAGDVYSDLMDVDSAINYYWVQEVFRNNDGFVTDSTYLYKPRNERLYWGPVWDFDVAACGSRWGNISHTNSTSSSGFIENNRMWFGRLLENREFTRKVLDRWPDIKENLLKTCEDGGSLDRYADELSVSAKYNKEKWGFFPVDNHTQAQENNFTYRQEVDIYKKWMSDRIKWIDENISELVPVYKNVKGISIINGVNNDLVRIAWNGNSKSDGFQIKHRVNSTQKWKYDYAKNNYYNAKVKKGSIFEYRIRSYTEIKSKKYYGNWTSLQRIYNNSEKVKTKLSMKGKNAVIYYSKLKSPLGKIKYQIAIQKYNGKWKYIKTYDSKYNAKISLRKCYKFKVRPLIKYKNHYYYGIFTKTNYRYSADASILSIKRHGSSVRITVKKAAGVTGFQYSVSKDNKFKNSYEISKNNKSKYSLLIKNIDSKENYFVKARCYKSYDGKKYYGKYSNIVRF